MATITVTGTPKAGVPTPSVYLAIFVDNVKVAEKTVAASQVVLNQPYLITASYTATGTHTAYGLMTLSNPVATIDVKSETVQFTIAQTPPTGFVGLTAQEGVQTTVQAAGTVTAGNPLPHMYLALERYRADFDMWIRVNSADFYNVPLNTVKTVGAIFDVPGTYTVRTHMTLGNDVGVSEQIGDPVVITVAGGATAALDAVFTASPMSGDAPFTTSFNVAVSGGVPPYQYLLNYGDGSTDRVSSATHTYISSGTYTAWMMVTDSAGFSVSKNVVIGVGEPAPDPSQIVVFSWTFTPGAASSSPVFFTSPNGTLHAVYEGQTYIEYADGHAIVI